MIIVGENLSDRVEICNVKEDGAIVLMDILFYLIGKDPDNWIIAHVAARFRYDDLRFLKESYVKLLNGESGHFGFASIDKELCVWVNSDLYHEIDIQDGMTASHCNLYFTPNIPSLHLLCKETDNLISGNNHCNSIKTIEKNVLSVTFPKITEYVDHDLVVYVTEIVLSHVLMRQVSDTNIADIKDIKTKVERFKTGELSSFNHMGEFYDIDFIRTENGIMIKGTFSDFSSPDENEVVFQEETDRGILDTMIDSLNNLERLIADNNFKLYDNENE